MSKSYEQHYSVAKVWGVYGSNVAASGKCLMLLPEQNDCVEHRADGHVGSFRTSCGALLCKYKASSIDKSAFCRALAPCIMLKA